MNLDLKLTASISKILLRAKAKDDVVKRLVRVTFTKDFDDEIAAELGKDAQNALKGLSDLGLERVVIPLSAVVATGKLSFDMPPAKVGGLVEKDKITIKAMRGWKAVATAGKKEDEAPVIAITFEFDLFESAFLFLARHLAAWVDVSLKSDQEMLPFHEPRPRLVGADDPYVPKPGEAF
jgi:hypothetical protein